MLDQFRQRLGLAAPGFGLDVGQGVAHDVGLGVAGADGIYRHRLLRQFEGQCAGEAEHAVLGRAIGGDIGVALERSRAGDIDDAPPAGLQHAWQHRMDAEVGAGEVHRQHLVPQGEVGLAYRRAHRLAGIVDEYGHRAERLGGGGKRGRGRFRIGKVDGLAMHLAQRPQARGFVFQRSGIAAHQGDGGALFDQGARDRGTDAASAAGNHGVTATQGGQGRFHVIDSCCSRMVRCSVRRLPRGRRRFKMVRGYSRLDVEK